MSKRSDQLVEQLHAAKTDAERIAALDAIAAARMPDVVDVLLPFALRSPGLLAWPSTRHEAVAARAALAASLKAASSLTVARLERTIGVRSELAWDVTERKIDRVDALRKQLHGWAAVAMYSYDRSGQVREASVHALDEIDQDGVIPFLVLRTADWVSQVRAAALSALRKRLFPKWAPDFVRALPLVAHLARHRTAERGQGVMRDAVLGLLKDPACRGALEEGLDHSDHLVRRELYPMLIETAASKKTLLDRAQRDADVVVRLWAVREARKRIESAEAVAFLRGFRADAFAPVRAKALDELEGLLGDAAVDDAEAALLDRSPALRATARAVLARQGRTVFVPHYVAAMTAASSADELATAIAGLGEVGGADEGLALLEFLGHASVRVRAAAVRAYAKLLGDDAVDDVLPLVGDGSKRVSREVQRCLERRLVGPVIPALEQMLQGGATAVPALELLATLPKWEALRSLLMGCRQTDAVLRARALELLVLWVSQSTRSQRPLERAEAVRLLEQLNALGEGIPTVTREQIAFELGFWGAR